MKPSNCQLWLSLAFAAFTLTASAASVTLTDSIVSLATNGTKYYTFVDPVSGHFVQVALTMSVHSSDPVDVFTSLDGDTRLGIGNPSIGGDGNHIDTSEGVNFAASVVTVSSGVAANSIGFRIVSLGLRDTGGGNPYWFSYASNSNSLPLSGEAVYSLDSASAGLFGASYLGYLRGVPGSGTYQITDVASGGQGLTLNLTFTATANSDPRTNSWLTTYTSRYARIYTNDAAKTAGNAVTTWNNGTQNQASPAYAGVQAVYSSSSWVYLQTSGLGQHTMGPWLNGSFPNLPKNQNVLYRIPRTPTVHTATNLTGLGAIGYFVDGVAMFDSRDAFYWNGTTEVTGTGSWNREAYVNEGATFDPGYAHQENTGTHHYHADPVALRYLLGDHVGFNASTKTYSESTNTVTKHSPILGWVRDGYPVYGPYGYSSASNSASGIRRMISGYQLRNGQNGTDTLTTRTSIPLWAARMYGVSQNQSGPTVSTSYPLGRYMEDNAYLGDLGKIQGVDFDLDEYNGRWCVTPEFPNGTYAYFVSISSNGTPTFPYNIGRAFYGNPTGAAATIAETVTTNFLGGANLRETLNAPTKTGSTVVLTWSAVEGGTYRVESTTNLTTWITNATGVAAAQNTGSNTNTSTDTMRFYRVSRTALAAYDGSSGGGGSTVAVPGGSASRGTTVSVTITLPTTPPWPPANAPISSVTLAGTIAGTSITDATQGTVLCTFTIPAGAPTGAQNVVVVFNMGPTYTLTGGLTIN